MHFFTGKIMKLFYKYIDKWCIHTLSIINMIPFQGILRNYSQTKPCCFPEMHRLVHLVVVDLLRNIAEKSYPSKGAAHY